MAFVLWLLCLVISLASASLASDASSSDELCSVCRLAVSSIRRSEVTNKIIHTNVIGLLGRVCSVVDVNRREFCLSVVKDISQGLLQTVLRDATSEQICVAMTVCPVSLATLPEESPKPVRANSASCDLCEFLVRNIDRFLKNKTSPAAVNNTVFQFCDVLPQPAKDTCLSFASLIVDAITQGVDPLGACTNIGVCAAAHVPQEAALPLLDLKRVTANNLTCELCELLVEAVDTYIKQNSSEAAINATVYRICSALPGPLKTECLAIAPVLVAALSNGADPKNACTTIRLCTSENHASLKKEEASNATCALCELVIQTVDTYIKQNRSEAAINATIYKICTALPDPIKTECLTFAPMLVTLISNGVDPKKACTAIHLCTSEKLAPFIEDELSSNETCALCELLVQYVDTYLKDNRTETAINATVYKLCNVLPGPIKTECLTFAPMIVTVLSNGADPKKACTAIRLCTSESLSELVRRLQATSPATCAVCELLVQTVDVIIKENHTEAAINSTIYKICGSLPGSLKAECLIFAPMLVTLLSNGFDPQKACTAIKLCNQTETSQNLLHNFSIVTASNNSVECDVCRNAINIIDQDLYRQEDKIQGLLDGICQRLPPPTDSACLTAADDKFTEIFEIFLTGKASAENVCKNLLKLCS